MYVFLTPSKTDGRVPSQQGVPTICNLTYWEVSQQRYLQALLAGLGEATGQNSDLQWGQRGAQKHGCGQKANLSLQGVGKFLAKKLMPDILHIKSQQTSTVIFFQATLSIFGHTTSSKLPSSKNWPEEHMFFQKQIYWVPLIHVMAVKNSGARAGFLIYSYFKGSVFTAIIFRLSWLFLFFLRESFVK